MSNIHRIIDISSHAMLQANTCICCIWMHHNMPSQGNSLSDDCENHCQAHAIGILLQLLLICNVRFTPHFQTELGVRGRKRFSCFRISVGSGKGRSANRMQYTQLDKSWLTSLEFWVLPVLPEPSFGIYLSSQEQAARHLKLPAACFITQRWLTSHDETKRAQSSRNYDKLQTNTWIQ